MASETGFVLSGFWKSENVTLIVPTVALIGVNVTMFPNILQEIVLFELSWEVHV